MNGEYSMNNLNGYYNDGRHEYEYNDHKHQSDYPPIAMLFIILFCSLSLNLFRCLYFFFPRAGLRVNVPIIRYLFLVATPSFYGSEKCHHGCCCSARSRCSLGVPS